MTLDYRENPCDFEKLSMTRDQALNSGHYMTDGHDSTSSLLFMGCQEKSEDDQKIIFDSETSPDELRRKTL
ncbi:MAG: hypothetical protein ACOYOS_01085 [Syntrophales bacterium]